MQRITIQLVGEVYCTVNEDRILIDIGKVKRYLCSVGRINVDKVFSSRVKTRSNNQEHQDEEHIGFSHLWLEAESARLIIYTEFLTTGGMQQCLSPIRQLVNT